MTCMKWFSFLMFPLFFINFLWLLTIKIFWIMLLVMHFIILNFSYRAQIKCPKYPIFQVIWFDHSQWDKPVLPLIIPNWLNCADGLGQKPVSIMHLLLQRYLFHSYISLGKKILFSIQNNNCITIRIKNKENIL